MQDYYAARANDYDRIYLKPERQADLRQIESWLPKVFAGRSVLEVACGSGYWTQFYAPAAGGRCVSPPLLRGQVRRRFCRLLVVAHPALEDR